MRKGILFLCLSSPFWGGAQVYEQSKDTLIHRYLMDDSYFIETAYSLSNHEFAFTRGGFYSNTDQGIEVQFEFNSSFAKDSLISYAFKKTAAWKKISSPDQQLEGKWLMAGRVKEEVEQRRDLTGARKTMKLLLDGYFQWTAFNTATFRFMGCGGGVYTAKNGDYVEHIDYFSRDDSRVGKVLPFSYAEKGNDWYHKGLSSKGKPMHEIWHRRGEN